MMYVNPFIYMCKHKNVSVYTCVYLKVRCAGGM